MYSSTWLLELFHGPRTASSYNLSEAKKISPCTNILHHRHQNQFIILVPLYKDGKEALVHCSSLTQYQFLVPILHWSDYHSISSAVSRSSLFLKVVISVHSAMFLFLVALLYVVASLVLCRAPLSFSKGYISTQ
jgi:hypothetical protein